MTCITAAYWRTEQSVQMSFDPKFVELTADVLEIFFEKSAMSLAGIRSSNLSPSEQRAPKMGYLMHAPQRTPRAKKNRVREAHLKASASSAF